MTEKIQTQSTDQSSVPAGDWEKPTPQENADKTVAQDAGSKFREFADDAVETLRGVGKSAGETAADKAGAAYDDARHAAVHGVNRARHAARRAGGQAETFFDDYPLMVGVLGLAGGALLGAMLPETRQENRHLGRWRDDLRRQAAAYGREATKSAGNLAEGAIQEAHRKLDEGIEQSRTG